ncbi:hypothetical protein K474DRAFT_1660131 [Panus rudis PR-1116 ss-1]|nr:hypothetical protein K474DRAFT_1660131 [Panus rudis PR-1116 ss-1]
MSYNAEDGLRWERYAAAFTACINGQGPHPGEPPAGYRECYKIRQRYAPLPEEYPGLRDRVRTENQLAHNAQPTPMTLGGGVSMSSDAFQSFLTSQQALTAMLQQAYTLQSDPGRPTFRSTASRGRGFTGNWGQGTNRGRNGYRGGRNQGQDRPSPLAAKRPEKLADRIDQEHAKTNSPKRGGRPHGSGSRRNYHRRNRKDNHDNDDGGPDPQPAASNPIEDGPAEDLPDDSVGDIDMADGEGEDDEFANVGPNGEYTDDTLAY